MKCTFVHVEPCELEFYLFEDEVDEKMKKKFKKMGFPKIWVQYPSNADDKLKDLGDGLFQQGEFQCSSFTMIEPTAEGCYEVRYDEAKNSVRLKLEGTFFTGNDPEIYDDTSETEYMLSQTEGIIQVITLNNEKAKPIKKPKDQWGMSDPIEALAGDLEYNNKGYGIRFQLTTKRGTYIGGEIIPD